MWSIKYINTSNALVDSIANLYVRYIDASVMLSKRSLLIKIYAGGEASGAAAVPRAGEFHFNTIILSLNWEKFARELASQSY